MIIPLTSHLRVICDNLVFSNMKTEESQQISAQSPELMEIKNHLIRLRGNPRCTPDASIIVPINAQADLWTIRTLFADILRYTGKYAIEIILVVNNYPRSNPPGEIDLFRSLGFGVVAVPSARRSGEVVIVSARALGVRATKSEITIHFDADCRVADINALLDWFIESLNAGASLAYSHVGYYELRKLMSVRAKIAIHHTIRRFKRNILRIPTTRGSNYAVNKSVFLELYDAGKLSVDLQIGPAVKLTGCRIAYSGHPSLRVLTSGRRFRGGWIKMFGYFRYRLHFNLKATPTRKRDVTRTTWDGFDKESDNRDAHVLAETQPD